MKRFLISMTLMCSIIFTTFPSYATYLSYEDYPVYLKKEPFAKNQTYYIPLMESSKGIDIKSSYDSKNKTAVITKGKNNLKIKANSNDAVLNGKNVKLKSPPLIKDNILYIPANIFSTQFNDKVNYMKETDTVSINCAPFVEEKIPEIAPDDLDNIFNLKSASPEEKAILEKHRKKLKLVTFNSRKDTKRDLKFLNISPKDVDCIMKYLNINWQRKACEIANAVLLPVKSRASLKKEMLENGFTQKEVDYAISNADQEWNKIAYYLLFNLKKLKNMSLNELENYLINTEQFTKEEAKYAVSRFPTAFIDKKTNKANLQLFSAYDDAYRQNCFMPSKVYLMFDLKELGYPEQTAKKAIELYHPDFKQNALLYAQILKGGDKNISKAQIKQSLTQSKFTKEEIDYALKNMK